MTDVPEGQVPRDAAFWRTFHAVQREEYHASVRAQCAREGHDLVLWGGTGARDGCQRCLMSREETLRDMGFVLEGDRWVSRPPVGVGLRAPAWHSDPGPARVD